MSNINLSGMMATPPDSPGGLLRQDSQEDDVCGIYRFSSAESESLFK